VSAPGKSPVKMKQEVCDITSWGSYMLFILTGQHVSLHVVNVTLTDLYPLAFVLNCLHQFWIAARLVCSEALAGSLLMASTALSLAGIVMVDSAVVGICIV
jgi:hypothetical protein